MEDILGLHILFSFASIGLENIKYCSKDRVIKAINIEEKEPSHSTQEKLKQLEQKIEKDKENDQQWRKGIEKQISKLSKSDKEEEHIEIIQDQPQNGTENFFSKILNVAKAFNTFTNFARNAFNVYEYIVSWCY